MGLHVWELCCTCRCCKSACAWVMKNCQKVFCKCFTCFFFFYISKSLSVCVCVCVCLRLWNILQGWGLLIRLFWVSFGVCLSVCVCVCVCVCTALCVRSSDWNRGSLVSNRRSADACPAESCKVPPFDRVSIQSQWAGSKPARQAAAQPSTGAVQEVSVIHMVLSCKCTHPRLNNSWNFYVCSLAFFFP